MFTRSARGRFLRVKLVECISAVLRASSDGNLAILAFSAGELPQLICPRAPRSLLADGLKEAVGIPLLALVALEEFLL
jgi:hypothetical protein